MGKKNNLIFTVYLPLFYVNNRYVPVFSFQKVADLGVLI